ncbi:hypothetical protein FIBSPDRAFT_84357 [Athelia psychrophila]|uniref:Secreted protein n=1 Tax=Athelia psychrophila TaxID=1759441 RepID=A0A166E501_9AGAM|nr:hypothetical protein FIBSPDRAFT_84357 [Fibularhizoctonia sp. CBS 109695]
MQLRTGSNITAILVQLLCSTRLGSTFSAPACVRVLFESRSHNHSIKLPLPFRLGSLRGEQGPVFGGRHPRVFKGIGALASVCVCAPGTVQFSNSFDWWEVCYRCATTTSALAYRSTKR